MENLGGKLQEVCFIAALMLHVYMAGIPFGSEYTLKRVFGSGIFSKSGGHHGIGRISFSMPDFDPFGENENTFHAQFSPFKWRLTYNFNIGDWVDEHHSVQLSLYALATDYFIREDDCLTVRPSDEQSFSRRFRSFLKKLF